MTIADFQAILIQRMWRLKWPFDREVVSLSDSTKFRHDGEMETVVFANTKGERFIVTIEKMR